MKNHLKLVLLIFSFVPFTFLTAQEYFFGVKGGVNYNSIGDLYHYGEETGVGGNLTPDESTLFSAEKEMGSQFGAFAVIDFERFYIRPEINFISIKNKYPLALNTTEWTSSKVDIPILIGTRINDLFSIYGGPVYSSISDTKLEGLKQLDGTDETPFEFDKSSVGISAGFMVEYGRFGLDFRYDYGLTSVKKQDRIKLIRATYGTFVADLNEYNASTISINLNIKLFGFNNPNASVERKKSRFFDWRNHKNLR